MYLDVTSYMLTVLTFSVGFLSTRRHAHFDVLAKDLSDRSWKIRQALNSGQDLGPRDLAEDVAAVTVESDAVAKFARVVNAFFFVAACVVFVMTLVDRDDGYGAVTLASILFASTALVFALGEYDVRWMASREQDLASGTVLGQLAAIDRALRLEQGSRARVEMLSLREAFPNWTFGRELELVLQHADSGKSHSSAAALNPLSLLDSGSTLYAAPLLVAETRLRRDDPIGALQDFQIVLPRSAKSRTFDRLGGVLSFAAGLPRAVFVEIAGQGYQSSGHGGLDLELDTLPYVRGATRSFDDFGSESSLQDWIDRQTDTPAWLVCRFALASDKELDDLLPIAFESLYAGALNSLGIVCLARRRIHDALRIFEAAIRTRPNSSTSHWGRALACARHEWRDAALESLKRAEALDPGSPALVALTQRFVRDDSLDLGGDGFGDTIDGPDDLGRIQLALLGAPLLSPVTARGPRGELVNRVVDLALAPVRNERVRSG